MRQCWLRKARFSLNGNESIVLLSPDHVQVGEGAVRRSRFIAPHMMAATNNLILTRVTAWVRNVPQARWRFAAHLDEALHSCWAIHS